jgi:hypothetical protein
VWLRGTRRSRGEERSLESLVVMGVRACVSGVGGVSTGGRDAGVRGEGRGSEGRPARRGATATASLQNVWYPSCSSAFEVKAGHSDGGKEPSVMGEWRQETTDRVR